MHGILEKVMKGATYLAMKSSSSLSDECSDCTAFFGDVQDIFANYTVQVSIIKVTLHHQMNSLLIHCLCAIYWVIVSQKHALQWI